MKHNRVSGGRGSVRQRLTSLVALPFVVASVFVVGAGTPGGGANTSDVDPCEAEPVVVDDQSETTITPAGTRVIITLANCRDPQQTDQINEVVVTVNPTGTQEYVVFVGRFDTNMEVSGSRNYQQAELHLPTPPDSSICVEVNDTKHCVPPKD